MALLSTKTRLATCFRVKMKRPRRRRTNLKKKRWSITLRLAVLEMASLLTWGFVTIKMETSTEAISKMEDLAGSGFSNTATVCQAPMAVSLMRRLTRACLKLVSGRAKARWLGSTAQSSQAFGKTICGTRERWGSSISQSTLAPSLMTRCMAKAGFYWITVLSLRGSLTRVTAIVSANCCILQGTCTTDSIGTLWKKAGAKYATSMGRITKVVG